MHFCDKPNKDEAAPLVYGTQACHSCILVMTRRLCLYETRIGISYRFSS